MTKTFFSNLLLLAWTLQTVQASPFGYAVTNAGNVGTVDLNSGVFHPIGCVPGPCHPTGIGGGGIAIGPVGGIYVYDDTSTSLYRFNTSNGASTLIGNSGANFTVFGGLGDGRLFGVDFSGDLFRLNATTGATTKISHLFNFSSDGFIGTSLAGDGTNLYFTYEAPPFATAPHDPTLYRINPNTGAIQQLGLTGIDGISGSGFIGGNLYGFRSTCGDDGMGGFTCNQDSTYRLNTTTGAATFIGNSSPGDPIYGAVATPEPAAWTLSGLGLCGLALLRRSQR